ncbi:4-hydroxythreonine-4-phosphate dehydrogenase PdxA [Candidatus Pelagibacter sp.]|nr:4-hydroxythreonine-4-phosphate dehydrogenase PdxA [Candidatus Pelagibacter sp.]
MNNKPIIIVAGEPNSVFLEIFFKCKKKINIKKPIVLIASKKLLLLQMKKLGFDFEVNLINANKLKFNLLDNKKINLIDVEFKFNKIFDKISDNSNPYINESFRIALKILKEKNCSGLINGPISKKHFLKGQSLGITEYLSKKTKTNNVAMIIFNKRLSVSPVTTHLALKDVNKIISKKKIRTHIKLITEFYKKNFKKKPRIAITGLNPHCESNFKDCEEDKIIIPVIRFLKARNYHVAGPFPGDTIFMKENLKNFDVVVGMYHDQVLSPMKALFGFDAINITLGLPFVRISPDHGPNSTMLGKNLSNPQSLINGLKFLDK